MTLPTYNIGMPAEEFIGIKASALWAAGRADTRLLCDDRHGKRNGGGKTVAVIVLDDTTQPFMDRNYIRTLTGRRSYPYYDRVLPVLCDPSCEGGRVHYVDMKKLGKLMEHTPAGSPDRPRTIKLSQVAASGRHLEKAKREFERNL